MNGKWFYKLYFFVYVVFCLYELVSPENQAFTSHLQEHSGWVVAQGFNIIAAFGLFLFAFEKRGLLPLVFWKIFTPLFCAASLLSILHGESLKSILITTLLIAPLLIALIEFSYRNKVSNPKRA